MRLATAVSACEVLQVQIHFQEFPNPSRRSAIAAVLAFMCAMALPLARAAEMSEREKIDALIGMVESRKDLKFIRLGSEHSSTEAAQMLRTKLGFAGSRVKTADEFIKYVATQTVSGSPYYVLYPDGKRITSADFLRTELKRLAPGAAPVAAK